MTDLYPRLLFLPLVFAGWVNNQQPVEVWTLKRLVTHFVLFVMDLATRSVHIAGITTNPNHLFMMQVARNLTDYVDGCHGKRKLKPGSCFKQTFQLSQSMSLLGRTIPTI